MKLFNVNDGAVLRTFRNINGTHQTHWVMCLALLPDGRRFVCGSKDKNARIVEHGLARFGKKIDLRVASRDPKIDRTKGVSPRSKGEPCVQRGARP